jgi:hypothetical protein
MRMRRPPISVKRLQMTPSEADAGIFTGTSDCVMAANSSNSRIAQASQSK